MSDFIMAILWLIATGLIARSASVIAAHCPEPSEPSERLLHAGVIGIGMIVVGLTFVGACGTLNPVTGLLVPTGCALALQKIVSRQQPAVRPSVQLDVHPLGFRFLWAGVAAVIVGHSLVNGVRQFPTDWDTLMYHLPLIDSWIQSGSFASTQSARWSNSANSEVLGLWFAFPFSGDFLTPLNNVPVVLIWIVATYSLARRLGTSVAWSHIAALTCIAVHTTVHETDDASNDLMVPAFFLASLVYALRFRDAGRTGDLLLFGVSLGLLAGTKFFAAGYAFIAGVTFFFVSFSGSRFGPAIVASLKAIAVSLVFGGYWYVRNGVMTGYPLYPSGSPDLQRRIPHPDLSQTTLMGNDSPEVVEMYLDAVSRLCGPIHFWLLLLLPSILVGLLWNSFRSLPPLKGSSRILGVLLLATAGLTVITPMLVEDQPGTLNHLRWGYTPMRYSLCFLSVLSISGVVLLSTLIRSLPAWLALALSTMVLSMAGWQFVYRFWDRAEPHVCVAFVAGLLVVAMSGLSCICAKLNRTGAVAVCVVGLVAVASLIQSQSNFWHDGFDDHYNSFYVTDWFADGGDELSKEGSRTLVLDERPYAFFGSARQNVCIQPMVYDNIQETQRLVRDHDIQRIITRVESHKILARYRPSWSELDADARFHQIGSGIQLHIFEPERR